MRSKLMGEDILQRFWEMQGEMVFADVQQLLQEEEEGEQEEEEKDVSQASALTATPSFWLKFFGCNSFRYISDALND